MHHNLTKEQSRMVKDHNLDYFKDNNFSHELKQNILHYAVSLAKIDIIKHYMEQGIKVTSSGCLNELMKKNAKIDTLEYLESKGVNFNEPILLLAAIKDKNLKFAQFISPKVTSWDEFNLKYAIKSSIESFDDMPKATKIFNTLLKQINSDSMHEILDEITDSRLVEKKTFVFNQFLKLNLTQNTVKVKKIKI